MTRTQSPRTWRVLIGGMAGLVGVGVIGAALAFPAATAPQALPTAAVITSPWVTPAAPDTASAPTATSTPTTAPTATTPDDRELAESAPTRVTIPSIGVDAGTVPLGLDGNELATPADPDVVGWFTGAHTPGAPGRAVLAGHLTWNGRHTVFARLPELAVGAIVDVEREDGTTARFEITKVATFAKDTFPTAEVYAATDEPTLVLITCGGEYDPSQHYYDSNVIAFATALTG
ncbi:class F sortase [Tessaracoccus sp. SD287]|uniref:sortase domain-containing protein n=1 Tax=Tessaracoccus sp. SD287 TaxID=2782008 RepID=UPI001A95F038|nr:sortase [Tessaracoccus sp. SD287]MBO1030595.1 class F sortase [Tessaracoccus sp. SD287]